jgi:hypothetical protein
VTLPDGNVAVLAVKAALSQVGVKYTWGGATPQAGFDCSGLVLWSYGQAGLPGLPHYTGAQILLGQPISTSDRTKWQVGDLIFPDLGHVQLYVGQGMVVESPKPGSHVQQVSEWTSSLVGVRRLVGTAPANYNPATGAAATASGGTAVATTDPNCAIKIFGACLWQDGWSRAVLGGLYVGAGSLLMLGAFILMTAGTKKGQEVLSKTGPAGQALKLVAE